MKASKNHSLSAESDLKQAEEYFRQGDYKQSLRMIKKKMQKLKSPVDKAYFNILKLNIFQKTKQSKEEKELLSQLIKEFKENEELNSDEPIMNYFKQYLRNNDEIKAAQELLKIQLDRKDLNNLDEKEQRNILKELCLGYQFKEIYATCNKFLKKKNLVQEKYIILIQHEAVFYLYKNKSLSENMIRKIFDKFLNNMELYRDQTGYFDIIAQFLDAFKEDEKMINILSQRKKEELLHVPLEEIKLDKFYRDKKYDEIIKILFNKIKENPQKCLFNDYEKMINLIFTYCEGNNIKFDINKIIKDPVVENINKELISIEKDPNELLKTIIELFENIKITTGQKIINSYKSGILGQLMICHNIIKISKQFDEEIHSYMKDLIIQLLDKTVQKQAILFEISKYFIYLNEKDINDICLKYKPDKVDESNFEELNNENLNNFIFYLKLRKCFGMDKDKPVSEIMIFIFKAYLFATKNIIKNTKLEKGERGIADDLIVLANEYYYEHFGEENNGKKLIEPSLSLILMCMNIYSRNKSPYNYDISYYLAKTFGHILLNEDASNTLVYMNLKGPQKDTISFFLFNYFENYQKGLNLLINYSDGWQIENRTNSNKTFWKFIDGGNFWKTQELFDFLDQNNYSYYHYLLKFYEIIMGYCEVIYNKEGIDDEKEKNYIEAIDKFYTKISPIMDKLVKNQDILFLMHKYDANNYSFFDNKYEKLTENKNYNENNFRSTLDSLNKKNNCLYELYPGYKNNYFEHKSISPFGEYDDNNCLFMRIISYLIVTKLNIENKNFDINATIELNNKYKEIANKVNNKLDINLSLLIDILLNSLKDTNYFLNNKDKIIELYSYFDESIIKKMNEYRNIMTFHNLEILSKLSSLFYKNRFFYFFLHTKITSKFLYFISDHKSENNDIANMKTKLNEIFKTPLINSLRDLQNKLDELLKQKNNKENEWDYENDIKTYFKDFNLDEEVFSEFKGFANKMKVKHSELFEDIKTEAKYIVDFVKQIL